jgi:predicted outer membrane protein
MATFFKGRTQNEKVREFSEMLIKDHTAFLEKLNSFSGAGRAIPGEAPGGNAGNIPTPQPANPAVATRTVPGERGGVEVQAGGVGVQVGANRSFYAPGMNPMLSLKEEIAQECMANAKKELEQKQGVEADKCFVGMQLGKHAEMVSVLTVLQRRAQDSQFKESLGEALQRTQHDLQTGKEIMKQLEQQRASQ